MIMAPKRFLSLLFLSLVALAPAAGQRACHFEGNAQLCENSDGDYVAVSTRSASLSISSRVSSTTAAMTASTASNTASIVVSTAPATAQTTPTSTSASVTALTGCHMHESVQFCTPAPTGTEIAVATQTSNESLPTSYTDCHSHDGEAYCVSPSGEDIPIHALDSSSTEADHTEAEADHTEAEAEAETDSDTSESQNCHFHAGIEHCTGGDTAAAATCTRPDREYNISIRIGSLFIVLFTSAIAVFTPILLKRLAKGIAITGIRFTIIKQFGTGVIIATAFVHLLTHAQLQFESDCLGELEYEGTVMAIAMAGAFVTFLVEWVGGRYVMHRRELKKGKGVNEGSINDVGVQAQDPEIVSRDYEGHGHHCGGDDKLSVWVMEAGIIFHSILIGITTVVAGDSGFWQLLIVIIFHQMFEGLALGSRISALETATTVSKSIMAGTFAFITPLGMGIGIGVLKHFNGSDKATIIALGTLNAFSAGILLWVGLVEMWAGDWVHGYLKRARFVLTAVAMVSLMLGMVLMGVLGKWA